MGLYVSKHQGWWGRWGGGRGVYPLPPQIFLRGGGKREGGQGPLFQNGHKSNCTQINNKYKTAQNLLSLHLSLNTCHPKG